MSAVHTAAPSRTAALVLLAAFLPAVGPPVLAAIIDIPADQPTIQAGITAASPGDTVLLAPGTYAETIDFTGKSIVVASRYLTTGDEGAITSTILNGGGTYGPLVSFTSGEDSLAVLVGLTLRDGRAMQGGGVYCYTGSPRIDACFFQMNEAQNDGGAVYARESSPIIDGCTFLHNTAVSMSGAPGVATHHRLPLLLQRGGRDGRGDLLRGLGPRHH
jgi:hypothetical protein